MGLGQVLEPQWVDHIWLVLHLWQRRLSGGGEIVTSCTCHLGVRGPQSWWRWPIPSERGLAIRDLHQGVRDRGLHRGWMELFRYSSWEDQSDHLWSDKMVQYFEILRRPQWIQTSKYIGKIFFNWAHPGQAIVFQHDLGKDWVFCHNSWLHRDCHRYLARIQTLLPWEPLHRVYARPFSYH